MKPALLLLLGLACGDKDPAGDSGGDGASADSGETGGDDSGETGGTDSGETGGTDSGETGGTDSGGADTGDPGGSDSGETGPTGDCDLQSDLADAHLWEGDTVAFTVACTGTLATEDAEISPVGLPDGAVWDEATRTLTWETGPADGGRHDLTFGSRPLGSSTIPTTADVTVWVADNPALPDAVAVDPVAYQEEWGLPVVHIETTGTLSTSEQDCTVTWLGDVLDCRIKIRGATSASYAKTSYTLDFPDDEIELPAWDVARSHLVLLANFDDNSHVRQKLVYDQWAAIAEYWEVDRLTPRTFYTVVYIDGAYHGLYVGLDRVDDEFAGQLGFDDSGNLYKSVNHDANFYLTKSGGGDKTTLHDGYEKKEGEPEDDFSDLDALVSFTGNASYSELVDGADAWFSLQEFMDWFLLVHFALAEDSAGKNAYLYHEPVLDQWLYVPWDFNHAWGQNWYTRRLDVTQVNSHTGTNKIFAAIQGDDDAEAELWERFRAMRTDGPYALSWMEGQLDAYYAEIDDAAQRDWDRWQVEYESAWWAPYRGSDWTTYEEEKAYVYAWVRDRDALFWERVP